MHRSVRLLSDADAEFHPWRGVPRSAMYYLPAARAVTGPQIMDRKLFENFEYF